MVFSSKRKRSAGVPVTASVHRILARGNAARERKDWERSAAAFREALQAAPELAHIWVQLGNMAKEQGSTEEAEAAYLRAINLQPNEAEPLLQLGHLFNVNRDNAKASEYYLLAFTMDPNLIDAAKAVLRVVESSQGPKRERLNMRLRAALSNCQMAESKATAAPLSQVSFPNGHLNILFDVSDLFSYFANARLPTGIQRVQIQIISHALDRAHGGIGICCLLDQYGYWVQIPADLFRRLVTLSLKNGNQKDKDWIIALYQLNIHLSISVPYTFPRGAYLVNLGGSWQRHNYFLFLREAKARYGIRYVPFVHDLIPIVMPQHFVKSARREFVSWVISVFGHADHLLANSDSTSRDVREAGSLLGRHLEPADVAVIRLDADFRADREYFQFEAAPENTLEKWSLGGETFILLVSTVESRKGHLIALNAWVNLIEHHGADKIPKLVCAGRRGWLSNPVYDRLEDNKTLSSRVVMLSGVSDSELSVLYQTCLFTIYPSHYEGWGLPITESLCYGKPVIASNNSSLPEAGGELAVYFKTDDLFALVTALDRMIFDIAYRDSIVTRILAEFRPRSWNDVADQIWDELSGFAERSFSTIGRTVAPAAQLGTYYTLGRSTALHIWSGSGVSEAFRVGLGWSAPEFDGTWTRSEGGMLLIGLPPRRPPLHIGLLLLGAANWEIDWHVDVVLGSSLSGSLGRRERKWVIFDYPVVDDQDILRIKIKSESHYGDEEKDIVSSDGGPNVGLAGFIIYSQDDRHTKAHVIQLIAQGNMDSIMAYR